MKTLLIYGAGAIGRGFIPWVFPPDEFNYFFIDTNRKLLNKINKGYVAFKTDGHTYTVHEVMPLTQMPKHYEAIIVSVGPRNCLSLADRFMMTEMPIVVCENDSRLASELMRITGNPNVVFAIPDVITSNRGPERDTGGVITEDGVCYIEDRVSFLGGQAVYLDEEQMRKQWLAKLYIHNTPHCIAAFLGYEHMCEFVHEAMMFNDVREVVEGAMKECSAMLEIIYQQEGSFLELYAMKELTRFSNPYLKDPVSRVAREPLRKLALSERLVGAANLCLQARIEPKYIAKGIEAAVHYDNPKDPDYLVMQYAKKLKGNEFLSFIGIPEREPIMKYLKEVK